jgi:hypothetical protein
VWTSGGAGELDERVRAAWIRRALIATGALLGAMAAAAVLSVEGGVFDRVGVWLTPAANAVATFLAWLLSQAARPVFFLVDLLGIDPERVREFLDGLREGALGRAMNQRQPGPPEIWQRMLGFAVFAAIGYAVFRAIRLFRPPAAGEPEPRAAGTQTEGALETAAAAPPRLRLRRELPADAVRRWYVETLLALRRLDIVREPWQTPTEFAPVVAEAVPACANEFERLTHAYEDVRYGSQRLDPTAIGRLEAGQQRIMSAIGRG